MTTATLLSKAKTQKIGETPVVVLPLNIWQKIEDALEDFEMIKSSKLRKDIKKSRAEIKKGLTVPFENL